MQTLADAPQPRGGAWSKDGTILYTPDSLSAMYRIPAAGGTPSKAIGDEKTAASLGSPRWPAFLPDGKHYIFFQFLPDTQGGGAIYLAALDSQQGTVLTKSDFRAQYASGHLVFVHGGNLMTQSFDDKTLKLTGKPLPIAEQVRGEARGDAAFSLSTEGKLIFAGGQATSLDLAWYDRTGKKGDIIDSGTFQDAHISPDGKRSLRRVPTPPATWKFTFTIWFVAPNRNSVFLSPGTTTPSGLSMATPSSSTPPVAARSISTPGPPMAPLRNNCSITTIWINRSIGLSTENTSDTKPYPTATSIYG